MDKQRLKVFLITLGVMLVAMLIMNWLNRPADDTVEQAISTQPVVANPFSTATLVPEPLTPTATETAVETESVTAVEPATLFMSEVLPANVRDSLQTIPLADEAAADLWFGLDQDAPSGEILHRAAWIYALAAPFPTLIDDVSAEDLGAFWMGETPDSFALVSQLYVPEVFAQLMGSQWGSPDVGQVVVYEQLPEINVLWEMNAWAILPFEALQPRLKVISLDGLSPLFKDFEPSLYPLIINFHIVRTHEDINLADLEVLNIISNLPSTNRDPEKTTILVMTGVTALVRGTAYRMERNGVLYPGERIRHWLVEADLTHISNEVSFYEDCPFPDPSSPSLLFCSDPRYIELLDYVGANIIELTGNHNNDVWYKFGYDATPFTLDLYAQYGMSYFGGGRDLADAKKPLLVTHNGNQFAFIGCNPHGPYWAWATDEHGGAAPCEDFQWMVNEIRRLRGEGYLPIATFQYYEDYYDFVKDWLHVRDYGLMADAGAIIVNGSQAHRPKAMAFTDDTFIDYGLGNLFFDQRWTIDMYGNIIVQTSWVIVQRHTFYDGRHLSTELLTAILEDFAQPRPSTTDERLMILSELFEASGWISR